MISYLPVPQFSTANGSFKKPIFKGTVFVNDRNLFLDFDQIEKGVQNKLPKYMEWFGAMGLMITLVWLYVEFLRLLSKLASKD